MPASAPAHKAELPIKIKLSAALILLALFFSPYQTQVEAAEFLSGIEVLVGPEEVYDTDIYAVAGRVLIEGTINGDLVVAGENIQIDGAVNGDLIVAARSIVVNGVVEDDIRAAGAELEFQSPVGGDLIAAGDQIHIGTDSVIGEDLVLSANTIASNGRVEGDFDFSAEEARIDGVVQGDVDARVQEHLILGPGSRIEGALNYTSQNEAIIEPGAELAGDVTQFVPMVSIFGNDYPFSAFIAFVSNFIDQVRWLIGSILVGLLLIWLIPQTLGNVIATFTDSPFKSLFTGVLMLPLTALLLILTMILVLSIIGFTGFSLIAIPALLYTLLLLLAKPVVAMSLGGYLRKFANHQKPFSPIAALAIGSSVLAVIGLIPYADSVAQWLTLIIGFGMWLFYFFRKYREARASRLT